MPVIKIKHIVSFSSEEPGHKADNLLSDDATQKWKCAAGEKQASVVFQLEKSTQLSSIDIGNEGSAFIEVLVGRSTSDNVQYQVMLVASSFMSPQESRQGSPPNRVRIFPKDKLVPDISTQKWDLVKMVCTQPFNKRTAYGISFIKLHTLDDDVQLTKATDSNTETTKSDESKKGERKTFGAFKIKEETQTPMSMGASMELYRMAKKGGWDIDSTQLSKIKTLEEARKLIKYYEGDDEDKESSPSRRRSCSPPEKEIEEKKRKIDTKPSQSKSTPVKFDKLKQKEARKTPSKITSLTAISQSSSKDSATKKKSPKKKKVFVPFDRILNGVIFAISGFQNPLRGDLRDKALSMGAQYRRDWTQDSTHLVCAFPNTPKYRQVMGCGGKIVRKEWITDCSSKRKLLSWKKYSMDPDQSDESSSEEEEEELQDEEETRIVKSEPEKQSDQEENPFDASTDEEECDTEDEIEKVQAGKNGEQANKVADDVYDASTDEEDHPNIKEDDNNNDLPILPNYFDDKQFMLYGTFSPDTKHLAKRHIIACGGKISEYMNEEIEYVITEQNWDNKFDQALADNASLIFVRPNWLFQCGIKKQFLPYQPFVVSPS